MTNVTLISTTNDVFEELIGKKGELRLDRHAYFYFDSEDCSYYFRHGNMRTSRIKNVEFKEISAGCWDITVTTTNSVYVWREGEPSDEPAKTDEERRMMDYAFLGLIGILTDLETPRNN